MIVGTISSQWLYQRASTSTARKFLPQNVRRAESRRHALRVRIVDDRGAIYVEHHGIVVRHTNRRCLFVCGLYAPGNFSAKRRGGWLLQLEERI